MTMFCDFPGCNSTFKDMNSLRLHKKGCHYDEGAKRDPSGVRYDILMPEFELIMAKIAHYGAEHYGDFNWTKSRLTGDKGPINHIKKHINKYLMEEPYDHPEVGVEKKIHLAAIAFNAMMEFWYETYKTEDASQAAHNSGTTENSGKTFTRI